MVGKIQQKKDPCFLKDFPFQDLALTKVTLVRAINTQWNMSADSFASLIELQCRAALMSPKFTKTPEVIDEEFLFSNSVF